MGANSKIEWCHDTFNPWEGCSKVSAGCANCYAEERANRFKTVIWGPHGTRKRTSKANWSKPSLWNRIAEVKGERRRVFCASLADVFEDRPDLDPWRADLFRLIRETPHLDWLLLTKRPENVMRLLSDNARFVDIKSEQWHWEFAWVNGRPPANVWIGTSVENQEQADKRIPHLLQVPAKVRFLSMEPLLGPVDLRSINYDHMVEINALNGDHGIYRPLQGRSENHINWVIVGGESGRNARPMHPDWVRDIRDQCQAAGVPFLFKQWGEWIVATGENCAIHEKDFLGGEAGCCWLDIDGKVEPVSSHGLSTDTFAMIRVGKHAAGRTLAGRTWDEVPEVSR